MWKRSAESRGFSGDDAPIGADGTYEHSGARVQHTYGAPFDGLIAVRVTGADHLRLTASPAGGPRVTRTVKVRRPRVR